MIKILMVGLALFIILILLLRFNLMVEMFFGNGAVRLAIASRIMGFDVKRHFIIDEFGLPNQIMPGLQQVSGILEKVRRRPWMLSRLRAGVRINELDWRTLIGTGDAMLTAITVGSLWTIKSMLAVFICQRLGVTKPSYMVTPDFTQQIFITRVRFDLRIKVIYAVVGFIMGKTAFDRLGIQRG